MRSRTTLSALTAALVLLSGCTPSAPVTTVAPTAVPTFQCTPEAGGTPSPCSQAEFEQMQKMDALYVEAERVYRKYLAEDVRLARQGGASEVTPTFMETVGDESVLAQIREVLRESKAAKKKVRGGEFVVRSIKRLPNVSEGGSVATILTCVDGTSSALYEGTRYMGPGPIYEEEVYFRYFEGQLKISLLKYGWVESCS